MSHKEPRGVPLIGAIFYGTFDQCRAIRRWEDAGWLFLHWTEVPTVIAVMEGPTGEINLIDENGWAWRGPGFDKDKPVPFEEWPAPGPDEFMVT